MKKLILILVFLFALGTSYHVVKIFFTRSVKESPFINTLCSKDNDNLPRYCLTDNGPLQFDKVNKILLFFYIINLYFLISYLSIFRFFGLLLMVYLLVIRNIFLVGIGLMLLFMVLMFQVLKYV